MSTSPAPSPAPAPARPVSRKRTRSAAGLAASLPAKRACPEGRERPPVASSVEDAPDQSLVLATPTPRPKPAKVARTLCREYEERAAKNVSKSVLGTSSPHTTHLRACFVLQGFRVVAGVDEAGRGPLAGPVVAAACVVSSTVKLEGINDSKKLSESERERLYEELTTHEGVQYGVGIVSHHDIDRINILQAALLAMEKAVAALPNAPDFVFVDGNRCPPNLRETTTVETVIRGDGKCFSIAASSIIAKVVRDRMMVDFDRQWPQYGLATHKGYPTTAHRQALAKHGPCPIHRMTFAPLKTWFGTPAKPATPKRKPATPTPKPKAKLSFKPLSLLRKVLRGKALAEGEQGEQEEQEEEGESDANVRANPVVSSVEQEEGRALPREDEIVVVKATPPRPSVKTRAQKRKAEEASSNEGEREEVVIKRGGVARGCPPPRATRLLAARGAKRRRV